MVWAPGNIRRGSAVYYVVKGPVIIYGIVEASSPTHCNFLLLEAVFYFFVKVLCCCLLVAHQE